MNKLNEEDEKIAMGIMELYKSNRTGFLGEDSKVSIFNECIKVNNLNVFRHFKKSLSFDRILKEFMKIDFYLFTADNIFMLNYILLLSIDCAGDMHCDAIIDFLKKQSKILLQYEHKYHIQSIIEYIEDKKK